MDKKLAMKILDECNYVCSFATYRVPMEEDTPNDELAGYPYCITNFPKRVMTPACDAHYFVYSIQHDKKRIVIEKWFLDAEQGVTNKLSTKTYEMPIYAMRIFILTHFFLNCQKNQFSKDLVNYMSDELPEGAKETDATVISVQDVDELYAHIFAPDTNEDLELEQKIMDLFGKSYGKYFSDEYDNVAKQNGIIDGYVSLRYLLKEILE